MIWLEVSSSPYIIHSQPPLLSYVIRRGVGLSLQRAPGLKRFEIVCLWRLSSLFFLSFPNETLALVARALLYIQTHVSVHLECQFYTHRKKPFFYFFRPRLVLGCCVDMFYKWQNREKEESEKNPQKNKRTSIGVRIGKEMRPQTASITNDF